MRTTFNWGPLYCWLPSQDAEEVKLAGLRWADSDVEVDQIRVRRSVYVLDGIVRVKATKNGRERAVSMGPQLRALLKQWKAADARQTRRCGGEFDSASYLFSNDPLGSTPMNVNALSWAFRKVADSLDPPLNPSPSTRSVTSPRPSY
jgi:integrase